MRLGLSTLQLAINATETRFLSQDRPLESGIWETTSPVRDSVPMEVDPEGGSNSMRQGAHLSGPTFANIVVGRNTSVFRPTPRGDVSLDHSAHGFPRSVGGYRGRYNSSREA